MTEAGHSSTQPGAPTPADALEHPKGTLAIVIVFGLLLGLAWLAMYLFLFLERGAPHS